MRTVDRSVELAAPADLVRAAARTTEAFAPVAGAMLRMHAAERIEVVDIGGDARTKTTDEGGGAVRSWRHGISVTPIGDGTCRDRDVVAIDAGPLTVVVAAFARVFSRYRQHRWRRLARLVAASDRARAVPET